MKGDFELMIEAITTGLSSLLGWIGTFLSDLLTAPTGDEATMYVLLPLVGLGAAFTVVKFGIHIVRSFAFGF